MKDQKRAIAILRVSTDAQDMERQRADIVRVERSYGLTIDRVVELDGVSGRKVRNNADMKRVLDDLERPYISGIAVSALDRLFRLDKFEDFAILDPFKDTGKTIWSSKEGALDLRTDAGLILSLMSGAQSGLEWRELRRRSMQGKEVLRTRGGCPNGPSSVPRGVGYEAVKDHRGRTIGAKWFYVEPDASRIRHAYDLLFERRSWNDIAERVGGGLTYNGVKSLLTNPIFMGIRRYSEGRDTPLDVQVISEPLISPERWHAAQAIILEKRSRWSKTKRPPHVLLSGLLRCACGRPCYIRFSGSGGYYYCSTGFPGHGPKCSARSVRQKPADEEIERFVSEDLLDAGYLRRIVGQFQPRQPKRDVGADKVAQKCEQLERERQRLLRLTLAGTCTEEDFARESKRIEADIRDLGRLAPAPVPALDSAKLIIRIQRTFTRFRKQPFEEKRGLLRTVFRDIVLEDGAITGLTLAGAALGDCVNSSPRYSRLSTLSS